MDPPDFLKPLIDLLPPDAQGFMNAGGWLVIVLLVALVALAILWGFLRRLFRPRRRTAVTEPNLTEDLSTYPPPPPLWGEQRLTIYGLPVRLRLVVAAPLGYEAGQVRGEDIEAILGQVVPGLGQVVRGDKPRIYIWPTQLSYQGFAAAFRRNTLLPDPESQLTRWVLLMGKALVERRPLAIGLVLLSEQENTIARVSLEHPHQWFETLRVKT